MSAISQAIRACAVESGASTTSLVSMDAMGAGGAWAKGPPAAERCARRGGRGPVEDGARVQWVFVSCPGVGKATYAGRLSRLHGVPHINTGALLRKPPLQRAATISPTHRAPPPSAPAVGQPPAVERRHRLPSSHRDPPGSKNPSTQSSPRFLNRTYRQPAYWRGVGRDPDGDGGPEVGGSEVRQRRARCGRGGEGWAGVGDEQRLGRALGEAEARGHSCAGRLPPPRQPLSTPMPAGHRRGGLDISSMTHIGVLLEREGKENIEQAVIRKAAAQSLVEHAEEEMHLKRLTMSRLPKFFIEASTD